MFSPVGQLGEEEVWREASSQPGEAAQDGEPGQARNGDPSWRRRGLSLSFRIGPVGDQEEDDCCDKEEDEEEGRGEGGREGEREDPSS